MKSDPGAASIALTGCMMAAVGMSAGCHMHKCDAPKRADVREHAMNVTEITPEKARELLEGNQGYVYLDVRTVQEFEAGRPPGAVNVPVAIPDSVTGRMELNPNFVAAVMARFPRDARLIVGCKSGGRSTSACEILRGQGYTNTLNMIGGYIGVPGPGGQIVEPGWSALGYPVEKGDAGQRGYAEPSPTMRP